MAELKILESREKPFPTDLEERLNAILNVVNTELKTATLLHLDDVPREGSEIKARVRETIGKDFYLPQSRAFGAYCHDTLYPIGILAEEVVTRESDSSIYLGYRLTDAGNKYGLPICFFTIEHVARTGRSMFEILGSTSSQRKMRAPLTRVKILKELGEKTLRAVDLAERISIDNENIRFLLSPLQKVGFVYFDSIGESKRGNPISEYHWIEGKKPEEAETVHSYLTLTNNIAEELSKKGNLNLKQLSEIFPSSGSHNIVHVVSGLIEQGLVKRGKWQSGKKYSEIKLLDEGRKFLDGYISVIEDCLNDGGTLGKLQEPYREDTNQTFEDKLQMAINYYVKLSPHINTRSREETNEKILKFLSENPGSRPCEIYKAFHLYSVTYFLTPLVKAGILKKVKVGKTARYFVNEN
ncbi:hypothetical protein HYV50_00185 [Candidatus Pacearchaeota archaeon]|nr:hypothetical protein [Candidatus Pacearchaeota archaeon]